MAYKTFLCWLLLLLAGQAISQPSFTQIGTVPFVCTDISFDTEGNMWLTRQQGPLLKNYVVVDSFPVQFVNECGLVGLYMYGGYAYLHISGQDSVQRVIRYDTAMETMDTLVEVPYTNPFGSRHRGGGIFVKDSIMYCSFGYGVLPEDAQNIEDWRGKLLKVNLNSMYTEIVLLGLRNPYRFDFDPIEGAGFVADVGSAVAEEVNYFTENYSLLNCGWPCFEGDSQLLDPDTLCTGYAYSFPEYMYTQTLPRAIIGGVFFNGNWYFTDHYTGKGGYIDSSWVYHELPIPFPQFVTGMAVDPSTQKLNVCTWAGKIYELNEGPLSIPEDQDTIKPKPEERILYDNPYWQMGWGFRYWDTVGRGYIKPPVGMVFYDRLYNKMLFIIE